MSNWLVPWVWQVAGEDSS